MRKVTFWIGVLAVTFTQASFAVTTIEVEEVCNRFLVGGNECRAAFAGHSRADANIVSLCFESRKPANRLGCLKKYGTQKIPFQSIEYCRTVFQNRGGDFLTVIGDCLESKAQASSTAASSSLDEESRQNLAEALRQIDAGHLGKARALISTVLRK